MISIHEKVKIIRKISCKLKKLLRNLPSFVVHRWIAFYYCTIRKKLNQRFYLVLDETDNG